jgi:hypothetical protein
MKHWTLDEYLYGPVEPVPEPVKRTPEEAAALVKAFQNMAAILEEQAVPENDRWIYVPAWMIRSLKKDKRRWRRHLRAHNAYRRNPKPRYYGGNQHVTMRTPY